MRKEASRSTTKPAVMSIEEYGATDWLFFFWLRDKPVADPGLGLEVQLATCAQLLAQVADGYAEVFWLGDRVCSPNGVEKVSVAEDPAGMMGHVEQKFELLGGKVHVDPAHLHPVLVHVNREIAELH